MQRLGAESKEAGNGQHFEQLKQYLTSANPQVPYGEAAQDLGMSEGAVKVEMYFLAEQTGGGLAHDLGEGRMGVTGAGEVLGRGLKFHRHRGLGRRLTGRLTDLLYEKGVERQTLQRLLPIPPLRIGVLTSPDSDGWNDFKKELEASGIGSSSHEQPSWLLNSASSQTPSITLIGSWCFLMSSMVRAEFSPES